MPSDLQILTMDCSRDKLENKFAAVKKKNPDLKISVFLREQNIVRTIGYLPFNTEFLLASYDGCIGVNGYITKMYQREYGYWPTIDFVPTNYGIDDRFKVTGEIYVITNAWYEKKRVKLSENNLRLSTYKIAGGFSLDDWELAPPTNRIYSAMQNITEFVEI